MKTSGITAALPAQDLGRAKAFYVEKVGLQARESGFLEAADGQVGLTVGDGVSQLFVYPARVRSSAEFTQGVIHVTDVRAAVEEMRGGRVQGFGRHPVRSGPGLRKICQQEASCPFFPAAGSRSRTWLRGLPSYAI